jgi:uncharacterized repeat protein (TIGR01451 family)
MIVTDGKPTVVAGTKDTYTIVVTNAGLSNATVPERTRLPQLFW